MKYLKKLYTVEGSQYNRFLYCLFSKIKLLDRFELDVESSWAHVSLSNSSMKMKSYDVTNDVDRIVC